jgi:hypothetical protein
MRYAGSAFLVAAGLALTVGLAGPTQAGEPIFKIVEDELVADIIIGKQIAPVPLTIPKGVNPLLVYRGSYIVNGVADCDGCHTASPNTEYVSGHNPFLGQTKQVNATCYLNGGQSFGPFVSRNLTPDNTGKPAGLTFTQFVSVIRNGTDFDNPGQLLQVMPWPTFQNMTDTDLQSIYAYLSSIPSLPNGSVDCGGAAQD